IVLKLGLVSDERLAEVEAKVENTDKIVQEMKNRSIQPEQMNAILQRENSSPIAQKTKLVNILARPQINIHNLAEADKDFEKYLAQFNAETLEQARSEEHTSELQSRENLVCRLLLEKKNKEVL